VKPMWEDEENKNGGKIAFKVKKEYTTLIWEELVIAMIGGVFPDNLKEEISGIIVSIRKDHNVIQLWFKNYNQTYINEIEYIIFLKL
jgi:hypothetical protein